MGLPQTIPYLGWAWDDLLFLAFAGALLGGALMVVLGRDIIRSGLWLIVALGALAGFYVLLGAPIVAAAQVLMYIGGIAVLILFAIMLTQSKGGPARLVFHRQTWAAALAAIGLAALFVFVFVSTEWPDEGALRPSETEDVARLLFRDFVLPFEIVSVLLLAAVIGGIFIARRDNTPEPGQRSPEDQRLQNVTPSSDEAPSASSEDRP